jgi:glutamate-1-semialdehyde 2,1-aminomutase
MSINRLVDPDHLAGLFRREQQAFTEANPESKRLAEEATRSLVGGVPMNWMSRWPGPFPLFGRSARGSRIVDADGNEYIDFCLGDTGAMPGHAPTATVNTIGNVAATGLTTMLPSEDSIAVGDELQRRFGLPVWQFALTATDANRFSIRLARWLTGRPKILVFSWCYHGSVDESLAVLDGDQVVIRPGNVGPPVDPSLTTRVVEFNDVDTLTAALEHHDVAAVLAEPALTNIGIVLPEPGFHDALREATRRTGTLLIIDETHTICAGPGGYTAAHGLDPDLLTIGKSIAGGVPAAAFGMTKDLAERAAVVLESPDGDAGGVGGTLAGNPLSAAAMRTTLENCLREEDFAVTIPLATRWADGVQAAIDELEIPWSVQQLGSRAEYWFSPPPRTGGEAASLADEDLAAFFHLYALNRGVLLTPFHNMALMAPSTTEADVDRHSEIFRDTALEVLGR